MQDVGDSITKEKLKTQQNINKKSGNHVLYLNNCFSNFDGISFACSTFCIVLCLQHIFSTSKDKQ